jgi:hypothetical protein
LPGTLGPGDRRMSFAYVEDVASGFVSAIERAGRQRLHPGRRQPHLSDLFAVFAAETGIPPPKIPYAAARLVGRLQRWRAEVFGIEPELTDEVVRIYARWAYPASAPSAIWLPRHPRSRHRQDRRVAAREEGVSPGAAVTPVAAVASQSVHIGMGGFALALRYLTPVQAGLRRSRLRSTSSLSTGDQPRAVARPREAVRLPLGIVLYPAAVLALIVVFRNRLELAAAGWSHRRRRRHGQRRRRTLRGPRLPWNANKSWSGFLAFVLWGTAASAFLIRWVQLGALDGPRTGSARRFAVGSHGPHFEPNL